MATSYSRLMATGSASQPAFGPNEERSYQVLGTHGIPATGVSAVLIDVAATSASAVDTGAILWPSGASRPSFAHLRFGSSNVPRSNTVAVAVGPDGKIVLGNGAGTTGFNIDIQGYFTASSASGAAPGGFVPVNPERIVDTVAGVGAPAARVAPGQKIRVTLAGVGETPSGASAVFANVEVSGMTVDGSLTVVPSGDSIAGVPPTVNYSVGGREKSGLSVALSAGGQADIFNTGTASVDVKLDVQGYFAGGSSTGGGFHISPPTQLLDTSTGTSLAAGEVRVIGVGGRGGIPVYGASGAMLTVTALNYTASGGVVVRPDGGASSTLPNVTFDASENGSNAATSVVRPGDYGRVLVRNNSTGQVDVRISVQGWFSAPRAVSAGDEAVFRGAAAAAGFSQDKIEQALYVGDAYNQVLLTFLKRASAGSATQAEKDVLNSKGLPVRLRL